ncbi:MAG: hypothetical protein WCR02_10770 [Sphaerochaetaceae bacterium]|jgi:aldose 1-epimerase
MARLFQIANERLSLLIHEHGCSMARLVLKGLPSPLMGLSSIAMYEKNPPSYAGAVVGPLCGRIKQGLVPIGKRICQLSVNEQGLNHLHGGEASLSHLKWTMTKLSTESMTLEAALPDGLEGYPGNRKFSCTYSLDQGTIVINLQARTDKPTLFNLTSHAYWNLNGDFTTSVGNHNGFFPATQFYPNDSHFVPQKSLSVAGTPFDFTRGRLLKTTGQGINNALHTSRGNVKGSLYSLSVETDAPDIWLYTGEFLGDETVIEGNIKGTSFCAFALEPQQVLIPLVTNPGELWQRTIRFTLAY